MLNATHTSDITVADYPFICRLCLCLLDDRESTQLFPADARISNDSLTELIKMYIGVPVRRGDGLPPGVCQLCSSRLYSWKAYRTNCGHAMRRLLEVQQGPQPATAINIEFVEQREFKEESKNELYPTNDDPCNDAAAGDDADYAMQAEYVHDDMDDVIDNTMIFLENPESPRNEDEDSIPLFKEHMLSIDIDYDIDHGVVDDGEDDDGVDNTADMDAAEDAATVAAANANTAEEAWRSIDADRPEQCFICGVLVTRLRNHMRNHPETMSFKCEHCTRAFSTDRGLLRHLCSVHPNHQSAAVDTQRLPSIIVRRQNNRQLRIAGKEFPNPDNGDLMPGRRVRSPCGCRLRCGERATPAMRQRAFDEYYSLGDRHKQYQYLAHRCDRSRPSVYQKPRKRHNDDNISATKGRYFLYDERFARVYVCRETFMATFDVNVRTVRTAQIMTNAIGELVPGPRPMAAAPIRQIRSRAKFRQPCDCRLKCATLVTPAIRQRTCDEFYALDKRDDQNRYIIDRCDRSGCAMVYEKRNPNGRRKKSTVAATSVADDECRQHKGRYFFYDVDGETRVYVCRKMFLSVFGLSLRMLQTATAAVGSAEAAAGLKAEAEEAEMAEDWV